MKLKSPKNAAPYFATQKKDGDKWVEDAQYNSIAGNLVKVEHGTYEYEGEVKNKIKLELSSETGTYVLESNLTGLARSIINCLASAELHSMSEIEINVYSNKRDYPAASVKENGKKLDWKYSIEDQPAVEKSEWKGKTLTDYSGVDKFFINVLLNEVGGKLNGSPAAAVTDVENPFKDDVPF